MNRNSARHVSVRVPWHDSLWNGSICRKPLDNSACLAITLIAESKDDQFELCNAGKRFDDLSNENLPPCVRERSNFLSSYPLPLSVTMPYSTWSEHHRHIKPTIVQLPAWGGVLVPYRWMLRETAKKIAHDLDIDLNLDREPKPPMPNFMVNTAWVQDVENQRAMLNAFAEPLVPSTSLIFFYAKRTPLSEGAESPIVAVAKLEYIGKVDEYPYSGGVAGGRVQSMIWERPFQHSLRKADDGFQGGVVLPYQEILSLAETDASIDPSEYLALVPEGARDEFLYGSEQVDHGSAITALQSIRNALDRIEKILPGRWAESIAWIDEQINELWTLRGPAPGLGSALSCIYPGAFNGTLFAHAIASILDSGSNPWPTVEQIFDGIRPTPFGAPPLTDMQRKRFMHIRAKQPERYLLMQMLSRFELSKEQAIEIWDAEHSLDYLKNPYEIYQRHRFDVRPIGLATIDHGIHGGGPIRDAWPLPAECRLKPAEPDESPRLLAAAIEALERSATDGHTLLPASMLAERVTQLPLSPPALLDALGLELLEDDFAPEIFVHQRDNEIYAQLDRYAETKLIIGRALRSRLENPPSIEAIDWLEKINVALDDDAGGAKHASGVADATELVARREKADALAIIAASRISVLIGPAGSGKTTLLRILLGEKAVVGSDVQLLAPTGKARVRLGSQTGMPSSAKTLAQFLLEQQRWDPETGVHIFPRTGTTARVTTCIVDEASMLTEDQLAALVSALPSSARLLLVGDPKQLPPIGAGRPFVDLIYHLEENENSTGVAELKISRRQKPDGDAINADALEDVQLAALFSGTANGPGEDEIMSIHYGDRVRLLEWDTSNRLRECVGEALSCELGSTESNLERAVDLSLGGTKDQIPYFNVGAGASAEAWQLLTPHRDRPGGSTDLNRHIKRIARANRLEAARRQGYGWKVIEPRGTDEITYGDKVICLKNHGRSRYHAATKQRGDGYLSNGEVGIVVGQTGTEGLEFTNIEFATQRGDTYSFAKRDFADHASPILQLGYAVTVHKSQGSEFDVTFLVLPRNSKLLTRELLYTAMTRQKDRIWILHQGAFGAFLRFRSEFYSETARRVTNLFSDPAMIAVEPPPLEKVSSGRNFLEQKLIHATRRRDLVSSKSEIVIADILYEFEQRDLLRYDFEKPKMLDGIIRWPDFTIDSKGDTWYWEHCGLLDSPSYRARWERKLAAYAKEGIEIWSPQNSNGRLIITHDGPNEGLDSGAIVDIATQIWG